jgi:hypothetical protein
VKVAEYATGPVVAYRLWRILPFQDLEGPPSVRLCSAGGRSPAGVIELHNHVYLDGREIFESVRKHAVHNMRAGGSGVPGTSSL